jgi:uncharacterized coiled-coil protein SlyX
MAVTNIKTVVEATVAPQIIALELKYKSAIDEARSIVEAQDKIIANNATAVGDTQLALNKMKQNLADMSKRLDTIEANIATLRADVDKLIAAN